MKHDPIRSSRWWKFDRCTISGKVVRPTEGAELQVYDPWEVFESVKGKYRTVRTLWGEFVETVRRIREDAAERYTPSESGESLILAWTQKYGLLGVLPGRVQIMVLPPTYERADEHLGGASVATGRCVVQRKYGRVAGTWLVHSHAVGDAEHMVKVPEWTPGEAVLKSAWPRGTENPQTTLWEWEEFAWKTSNDNRAMESFFVRQPPDGQFPQPLTPEFWATYQEPVWAWTRAALVFSESVELVSRYAVARYSGEAWPERELPRVNNALWILNALATSETNFYEFGQITIKRELTSASLLSVMAEMFFLDLLAGRRAIRCGTCQKIFISNDRNAGYCSVTCRNTAQTRRHRLRTKHKQAKELGAS